MVNGEPGQVSLDWVESLKNVRVFSRKLRKNNSKINMLALY